MRWIYFSKFNTQTDLAGVWPETNCLHFFLSSFSPHSARIKMEIFTRKMSALINQLINATMISFRSMVAISEPTRKQCESLWLLSGFSRAWNDLKLQWAVVQRAEFQRGYGTGSLSRLKTAKKRIYCRHYFANSLFAFYFGISLLLSRCHSLFSFSLLALMLTLHCRYIRDPLIYNNINFC